MYKISKILCLAMHISSIFALTEDEARTKFVQVLTECTKYYPVSAEELTVMQQTGVPPAVGNTKCLLACAYKMIGVISNDGMFSATRAQEIADQLLAQDNDRVEKSKQFMDLCLRVNQLAVSDGSRGCDRAAYLFQCVSLNAANYGFNL